MDDVHERPKGANAPDLSRKRLPWKPSDPARWATLGLADPAPFGALYAEAGVRDILMWGLAAPGSSDPIEGIIDGVRVELEAMADVKENPPPFKETLYICARRLLVAMKMLRWCDNREKMPLDSPDDPEDVEVTRDADPGAPSGA